MELLYKKINNINDSLLVIREIKRLYQLIQHEKNNKKLNNEITIIKHYIAILINYVKKINRQEKIKIDNYKKIYNKLVKYNERVKFYE